MAGTRQRVEAAQVRRELREGQSTALLQALHLLTPDGALNADARRKLKQVNHFLHLLEPLFADVLQRFGDPVVADLGAGNAYLAFLVYEAFLAQAGKGQVVAVDSRPELMSQGQARARALGFSRMSFLASAVESAPLPSRLHVVLALHACDTATDDALVAAVKANADHIAVVPCCQAEVAQLLKAARPQVPPAIGALFEHPWHRREFGSHLTNVVRALTLERFGYQVTVTELAGWEHSLKNELILGRKVQKENPQAAARLDALLAEVQVRPAVVRRLLG